MQLPIRIRLAVWYFAVLAGTFTAFSLLAYVEMRDSIRAGVDEELRDRLQGFRDLLTRASPFESPRSVALILAEHTGGNDLFQMADRAGAWVYRSPSAISLSRLLPTLGRVQDPAAMASVRAHGEPLRILTTTLPLSGSEYRVQVGERVGPYESTTARFGRTMLISIPVLLGVAMTGGLWLSRRALLPVDRITQEARAMTVQNLAKRLEVPRTGDELQRLCETLNAMLARLDAAFQRVTQFTADASHELKTPLALMRTMAEVPLRAAGPDDEVRAALAGIVRELARTSRLVDELLCIARGDSEAAVTNATHLDFSEVIRSAAARGELLAKERDLAFRSEITEAAMWIDGDRDALHRLLVILLDNATKYTPPHGTVTLRARLDGRSACVEVADTGVGIEQEDVPHIFDRFYRADRARTRDSGGTGLGLAIGRWIATAHGGTIAVASTPGKGSVFSFHLPLAD
ncbi:MAG TPA: ATP-binding protein [Steroidobacteraceae bacterium]|nr:ATP-binding protein [Steroidobacteraceae bacterium]